MNFVVLLNPFHSNPFILLRVYALVWVFFYDLGLVWPGTRVCDQILQLPINPIMTSTPSTFFLIPQKSNNDAHSGTSNSKKSSKMQTPVILDLQSIGVGDSWKL